MQFDVADLIGPLNDLEERYAPKELFVAGHHEWLSSVPRVSVVGSRTASDAGLEQARAVARLLVKRDALVVSGLAAGIDRSAHEATIQAGGRTAAILGTPLTSFYPRSNTRLQQELMRDHVVVSQFPSDRPEGRGAFPRRNRTMALLTHATVVIEAGEKSGTRHQAWEAIRLGRPVLLSRALLDAELEWAREVLQYGAVVFETTEELGLALDDLVPSALVDDLLDIA